MKKHLHLLCCSFIVAMALFSSGLYAQINYTANFNSGLNEWIAEGFSQTNSVPCSGGGALRANVYISTPDAQALSPEIGVSVGTPITVTYSYKVVNYSSGTPTVPTPASEAFGEIGLFYATSEDGEYTLADIINSENQVTSSSCTTRTVTINVPSGTPVYLAVASVLVNEDSDVFVYIDEVTATQAAATPCTGAPAASATIASRTVVCGSQNVTLSLNPFYSNTGITYQWQSSVNGTTFTNVTGTGSTSATYTATPSASTYYRAQVTCTASGQTTTSTPVLVSATGLPCFCEPEFLDDIEPITLVNFAGINNTSSAAVNGTPGYQDFTNIAPAQVVKGQTYPITLKGNTAGSYVNSFKVYIDFNHDGDFNDAGESFNAGTIEQSTGLDNVQAVTQITIPATAVTGLVQMRVIKIYTDEEPVEYPMGACDEYDYGQAEDYMVNIAAANSGCTTAPVTSTVIAANTTVCQGQNTALSLSNTYTAGETFQWQISTDNTTFTNIQGATSATYQTNQTASAYYRAVITCAQGNLSVTTASIQVQTQVTPAPVLATPASFCGSASVGNLKELLGGDTLSIYTTATGGTALNNTVALNNGTTYYASQTLSGCESTRLAIPVTITGTAAPVISAVSFCNSATVADFLNMQSVTGLQVYTANGQNPLPENTALVNGTTYTVRRVVNGCQSDATQVTITINTTPVPVPGIVPPAFCNGATVADLAAQIGGENIKVYAQQTGGTALSAVTVLTTGTTYYATQTLNACESNRIAIDATITTSPEPVAVSPQVINTPNATIADIEITAAEGGLIIWYATPEDAVNGTNPLPVTTVLDNDATTYYAVQVINNCNSEPVAVTVSIPLNTKDFNSDAFKLYPNPVSNTLNLQYNQAINTVEVYNLIGQQVIVNTVNANTATVNMGSLAAGTYMVKITAGNAVKIVKVVKQ